MNTSLTGVFPSYLSWATARRLATGLALLSALSAQAQWQWMDKDGRKVYSDRPPPADVLDKNIIKRPPGRAAPVAAAEVAPADGAPQAAVTAAATAASAAKAATGGNVPKLSGLDKELDEKKKKAAEADLAKRKVEEDRLAKARADNCVRAKNAKTSLDSGSRIGVTNAKGEREIMDDAARAAENARIQSVISSSCGTAAPQG